jgi:hypothetical protein
VEKPRKPGMLFVSGLGRLITYFYPLYGAYCVNFTMVYLIFIESENELYDPYNFDILPQCWKPAKYDVVCRLCLMRKDLHEFYKKGVNV